MAARDGSDFSPGIKMDVMATINNDGSPHLSPNWYYYDGARIILRNDERTEKFFNLKRDQRMAVCVYEPPLASEYEAVQGAATIDDLVPMSELWGQPG